jgi:hypothetical protein
VNLTIGVGVAILSQHQLETETEATEIRVSNDLPARRTA